ncbi:hypothetical protein FRACA_1180001 [Frankia canadensis]|uniref:Uncharacterized protein n=1 Tax=Frankia canadensis TaxID=1836972 RepID=A0A2I2KJQ8_9ACTN|nr:hypothetical protein FRACA_1180001 [Frankia canadensis]SOU53193.1 hypothetical protein FRACA_1180001 [Frankia canadensis]
MRTADRSARRRPDAHETRLTYVTGGAASVTTGRFRSGRADSLPVAPGDPRAGRRVGGRGIRHHPRPATAMASHGSSGRDSSRDSLILKRTASSLSAQHRSALRRRGESGGR